MLAVPVLNQWYWGDAIVFGIFAIPLVIVILVFSRWFARFARPRRLISYALLIEASTLVFMIALFLFAARAHRRIDRLDFPEPAPRFPVWVDARIHSSISIQLRHQL